MANLGELRDIVHRMQEEHMMLKNRVFELDAEKEMLRQGIRKLKMENIRMKEKMKAMKTAISEIGGQVIEAEPEIWEKEYDELGRNEFLLIGGKHDPLGTKYEATIKDDNGLEHKSVERFYWYKMAEHFGDADAMHKIQTAGTGIDAEEVAKNIKNFNEEKWKAEKVTYWEMGQRLKLEQVRPIQNLLVETGTTYIALADQDKQLGTGWRKNREEANKPIFWDGENLGGKFLMKYRQDLAKSHQWAGPFEKQETEKKHAEMKKYVWRRIDKTRFVAADMAGGMEAGEPSRRDAGVQRGRVVKKQPPFQSSIF
ncbi:unnamed protein product, partial [Mesorhabditis spiculigera]